ncbi:MAG: T9SS type A sorting domain-containing protein [Crocinitomicaceae bacterium]|nr:T9SS type A sorting domain-containing protein [Flavobacteriales bacterium]NQZ38455.1 T9SS type A sorting domain-containing protein [Crocinitomicaceae bacterium]
MKTILFLLLLLPYFGVSQTEVNIRTSTATWGPSINNNNTVHVDSVLIENGVGQGGAFKFCLVLFSPDCGLLDTLEIGQYNPFNTNYNVYHYRQIQTFDMAQIDSTIKYRISDGTHYFLYTPSLYRSDFVSSAYLPFYETLDSLWGNQVANATTVMILYGIKGNAVSHESVIAQQGETDIELNKIICEDAYVDELGSQDYFYVYPNPSNGIINIKFRSGKDHLLQVTNSSGRLVKELNVTNSLSAINLSDIGVGCYFLRVQDQGGVHFQQLIIE